MKIRLTVALIFLGLICLYFWRLFVISGAPANTLSLTATPSTVPVILPSAPLVKVVKVIDGDTIQLATGQKVRYIGIDTPELSANECYATKAALLNANLVLDKFVNLVKDKSDLDRYGRLLRYVYSNNTFVNLYLVSSGAAIAKTYPPDTRFATQFTKEQESAQTNGLGLWRECYPYSVVPRINS